MSDYDKNTQAMREWRDKAIAYKEERDVARARVDTLEAREIDFIVQIEEARRLAEKYRYDLASEMGDTSAGNIDEEARQYYPLPWKVEK